ncbi:transcriptional regulator with XRE-family HTH domain [Anaerosolibacter carboniphilus]|uniref:Transcriptional regulator with XRE-family HTH domain n=1 Tax=Anaerosolibacter carboniphilus TaxID=1417629 RepID=A0A841KMQ1_9FIRM|nr:helix-turn-helix transcriptional regulator [Anaerosolibacter carboniphilus]MBB6215074.1 transcriptional regulator with XRE-family HTH domain [Anaerosolibacter carboniphilus]
MSFKFSEFLKHELGKKVLKANELAKLMNRAPSYITKLQKEDIIPDYKDLKVIAEQFGIGYEFLLFQIGIIDVNTLLHINAFGNLKSYLSEIINLTNMTPEKIDIINTYMKENTDKLDFELTDDLIVETMKTLGDEFVFPSYKNPYGADSFRDFKKLPKIKIATGETSQVENQLKQLPVYSDFNVDGGVNVMTEIAIDIRTLKNKATNLESEFFWYSPYSSIRDLYLVEKVHCKDGDRVIYKKKDTIYTGKYNVKTTDDKINSVVFTDIIAPHKDEPVAVPEFFLENNIPADMLIIGKVLSVFKDA